MKQFAPVMSHVVSLSWHWASLRAAAISPCPTRRFGLALKVVIGNGQQGTVGQQLPIRARGGVEERDRRPRGRPEGGLPACERRPAEGFDPDTAVTDADGQAFTRWVLGTAPGPYSAEARIVADGDTHSHRRAAAGGRCRGRSGHAARGSDPPRSPVVAASRSTIRSRSWWWTASGIRSRAPTSSGR